MKLYYNPLSPNVRRVRLTAAVLGIELEEKLLDFSKGEHKTPDYLALNPNGAVPTLVDGDFVLSESRSIMQYLASKKPESGLLPRDEAARADVTRWQFWDAAHFSPQLGTLAFEKLIKGMIGLGEPDSAKITEALSNFRRFAAVLNQRLDRQTIRRRQQPHARGPHARLFTDVRQTNRSPARRLPQHRSLASAHHRPRRLEKNRQLNDWGAFTLGPRQPNDGERAGSSFDSPGCRAEPAQPSCWGCPDESSWRSQSS